MIALALLVAWLPQGVGPDPGSASGVHHVLVLDDSGSMETDFDVHGFGLAVPQLFQRFIGAAHPELLTVLTLAQGTPFGRVPTLQPADYLGYPRDNGTFYAKAIAQAVSVARASKAARVEIALLTDAEPDDATARATIDEALREDPRLHFTCFQLGTTDPGDLCVGRTSFARNGFDMARLMATHLAASLGSIPQWGRLDRAGAKVAIPLGRFVSRLHVMTLGARAGEDFAAELVGTAGAKSVVPLVVDHTRPVMPAELLLQAARTGPKSLMDLPVGASPRLALGTLSVAVDPAALPELRLVRAEGAVAWGVMLEYDLIVAIEAPPAIEANASTFTVRAHLTHKGVHVDDVAALAALGFTPSLSLAGATQALAMTLGADGWASAEVPAPLAEASWQWVARFRSPTADLASPAATVVRANPGKIEASAVPAPASAPTPTSAPPPTPTSAPTPTPTNASVPTPPISAWLPPTLDLPEWTLERQTLTYTLSVITAGNQPLTAAEIRAQQLTAAIVIDGAEVPMTLNGDRFEVTRVLPAGPTTLQAELVLRHPGGEIRSVPDRMDILPDAAVRLFLSLDLGLVAAGCDIDARCEPLDLSQSRAVDRIALRVTRTDAFDGLKTTLRRGDETFPLSAATPVELAPSAVPLEICWAPPGCVDLPDDLHAALTIAPADARLATADRSASTRVFAEVSPSSWLACNLWWCLLVGGGLMTLFIFWGYVRPYAFPSGAFIQVADQERRLAKDPGRPLRSVPHGRRGFYRTATCAIDPSGFTVKRTRPHVLQLKADRGGIALLSRGAAVERRQRGQWVPIDRTVEPFVLSGATYRVNQNFVFRVLA